MSADPLLSRLRALAAKATPAPWRIPGPGDYGDEHDIADERGDRVAGSFDNSGFVHPEDAALTVALRNAWPSLLARIEAGERVVEAINAERTDGHKPARSIRLKAALAEFERAKEEA